VSIWQLEQATVRKIVNASHRMYYGGAAAALFLLVQTSAFAQGTEGTQAQRDACTPDAFRLCMPYMPDPGRVEACLRAAGPNLSRPCYDVFFPMQEAPPPQAQPKNPRRRSNGPQPPLPPPPQDDDD
jgi:hypothetical protein